MVAVGPKRTTKKTAKRGPPPTGLQVPYLLSMELTNIRCFGPTQRFNFTDKSGAPARWTLLLGVNGNGKTTALQAIALLLNAKNLSQPPPGTIMRSYKRLRALFRRTSGQNNSAVTWVLRNAGSSNRAYPVDADTH